MTAAQTFCRANQALRMQSCLFTAPLIRTKSRPPPLFTPHPPGRHPLLSRPSRELHLICPSLNRASFSPCISLERKLCRPAKQVSTNEPLAHEQSKRNKYICTRVVVTYVFERVFDDDAISHQTRAVTKPVELRRCFLMRLVVGVGEMDVSRCYGSPTPSSKLRLQNPDRGLLLPALRKTCVE